MTENRFVELDRQVRRMRGDYSIPRIAGMQSFSPFSFPLATTNRALIVLIDNGGIDLQLGDVADGLLALVPGAIMLPDKVRQGIVDALHDKIKSVTKNLLETAELTLNRYTAAKPGLYGDVLVLRDGAATYADLKRALIAQTNAGKIIDVIILTHGANDNISAIDDINGAKIKAVRTEAGKPISIRSVYMMNCVGSSLNQAWIDAGAKTSCGTAKNNYLPEPTCHFFWEKWEAGQPFDSAATSAYRQTVNLLNDTVRSFLIASPIPGTTALANLIDFADFDFVKDSKPIVSGQGTVTISSDDLTFSQSQSRTSSLITTVLSMSDVAAAGTAPSMRTARAVSEAGLAFIRRFEPIERADPRIGAAEQTLTQTVSVPLSQSQIDALISFIVGIGADAFRTSTLLRELNAAHFSAVSDEIRKWTKVRQDGRIVDLPVLQARRAAEMDLFSGADPGAVAQSMTAFAGSMGAVNYSVANMITQPIIARIFEHVEGSDLVKYPWKDRGPAPIGYLKGMALTYARAYCHYQTDGLVMKMAKGVRPGADTTTDAVAKYANTFMKFGADVSVDGVHVLRGLFTILFGLGMRESGGKFCAGWDTSKTKGPHPIAPTATNSEAGLFQISYDIAMDRSDLDSLVESYKRRPSGFLDVFSEGVTCHFPEPDGGEIFGAGVGKDFQQLSKDCPSFSAELAALGLRTAARHWGPINVNTVEILQACWSLLLDVERAIDDLGGCVALD